MTHHVGETVRGGKDGERRQILSIEGDTVTFQSPISFVRGQATVAEFEAWKSALAV